MTYKVKTSLRFACVALINVSDTFMCKITSCTVIIIAFTNSLSLWKQLQSYYRVSCHTQHSAALTFILMIISLLSPLNYLTNYILMLTLGWFLDHCLAIVRKAKCFLHRCSTSEKLPKG